MSNISPSSPARLNITIHRGRTFPEMKMALKADGNPVDITDWSFKFIMYKASPSTYQIFEKTMGAGITLVDALIGRFNIDELAPESTLIIPQGNNRIELVAIKPGGDTFTYAEGTALTVTKL